MSQPPNLLNDDGTASMATLLMMSHHAFRRDVARFARALRHLQPGDVATQRALRDEWQWYRSGLHHHHTMEDQGIFPDVRAREPRLAATIDALMEDHHRIDPVLDQGDAAFAELPGPRALEVVEQLATLLHAHLSAEEAALVPLLRGAKGFPPPGSEAEAELQAQGFAWTLQGIAPEVVQQVDVTLPELLKRKLPAARAAFDERCIRVWGSAAAGAARTPIPDEA
jgi:Hemerythrin HHE cation binding domain